MAWQLPLTFAPGLRRGDRGSSERRGGRRKVFWASWGPLPTLLGEHQGVFPPRLGDDGAVFHLTIPRAPGWLAGGPGRTGGAPIGSDLGGSDRSLPIPRLLAHIPAPGQAKGDEPGRCKEGSEDGPAGAAAQPTGVPLPGPDPPRRRLWGSSLWVQHGESGAKTRGGNGTRGGFQAPRAPPYSR